MIRVNLLMRFESGTPPKGVPHAFSGGSKPANRRRDGLQRLRAGSFTVVATALLVVGAMVAAVYFFRPPEEAERREAPRSKSRHPELMSSGNRFSRIEAIQQGDGHRAVDLLRSFSFDRVRSKSTACSTWRRLTS
jgi:hypothetical protein